MIAVPGLVFQLTPQDQLAMPSAFADFGARSFEVEILPLGQVTSMVHAAPGFVLMAILASCFCATGLVSEVMINVSSGVGAVVGVDAGVSVGVGLSVGVEVVAPTLAVGEPTGNVGFGLGIAVAGGIMACGISCVGVGAGVGVAGSAVGVDEKVAVGTSSPDWRNKLAAPLPCVVGVAVVGDDEL